MVKILLPAIIGSLLFLASCGKDEEEVRVYQVSHPENREATEPEAPATTPPATQPPMMPPAQPGQEMRPLPGMTEAASAVGTPEWSVPTEWNELAPTAIRKGNFTAGETDRPVEITVTVFPGDVGGLEANVNRWRRQVGLGPLAPEEMEEVTRPIVVDGEEATFVDIAFPDAPQAEGILGAVIPRGERTWFVKAKGPSGTLNEQRPQLEAFLDSISF